MPDRRCNGQHYEKRQHNDASKNCGSGAPADDRIERRRSDRPNALGYPATYQPPLAELHGYFVADATPVAAFSMIDTTACGCDT